MEKGVTGCVCGGGGVRGQEMLSSLGRREAASKQAARLQSGETRVERGGGGMGGVAAAPPDREPFYWSSDRAVNQDWDRAKREAGLGETGRYRCGETGKNRSRAVTWGGEGTAEEREMWRVELNVKGTFLSSEMQ